MEQPINKLKKILQYLDDPLEGHHAGDKRICYLTFPFSMVLEVKKNLDTMISLIKHHNYNCEVLSLGNLIHDFFTKNPRRKNWSLFEKAEEKAEMTELFNGLGNAVKSSNLIENAILDKQRSLRQKSKPLLIITDLEGIHPFTRFGPVESSIYNEIEIPIIVLYPGEMNGESLKFLSFYPQDGNYRSKHY